MIAKNTTPLTFGLIIILAISTLSIHTVCAEEIFVKSKMLKIRHVISYLETNFVDVIESKENYSDVKLEEVFGIYQAGKEAEVYFELSYWAKVDIGEQAGKMEQRFDKKRVAFVRLNSGKWFNSIDFLYLTK